MASSHFQVISCEKKSTNIIEIEIIYNEHKFAARFVAQVLHFHTEKPKCIIKDEESSSEKSDTTNSFIIEQQEIPLKISSKKAQVQRFINSSSQKKGKRERNELANSQRTDIESDEEMSFDDLQPKFTQPNKAQKVEKNLQENSQKNPKAVPEIVSRTNKEQEFEFISPRVAKSNAIEKNRKMEENKLIHQVFVPEEQRCMIKGEYLDRYYLSKEVLNAHTEFIPPPANIPYEKLIIDGKDVSSMVEVRLIDTKIKNGLFAKETIQENDYIVYYGLIVNRKQDNRIQCKFGDYSIVNNSNFVSLAYYCNHSCNSNCELNTAEIMPEISGVIVRTKEQINKGEELTVSYGWTVDKEATICRCSSKVCQLFIENDAKAKLIAFLKSLKKVPKELQFSAETSIENLSSTKSNISAFQYLYCFLVASYSIKQKHVCGDTSQENFLNCLNCSLKFYEIYHKEKSNKLKVTTDAQEIWVSKRRTTGRMLYKVNQILGGTDNSNNPVNFEYYSEKSQTALYNFCTEFKSVLIDTNMINAEKFKNLYEHIHQ